jgi:hypothetical protein
MSGLLKTAGVAAIAAMLGFSAGPSRAAQVPAIPPDSSETVDGWIITTSAGIGLTDISVTGNTISLAKNAAFSGNVSLGISFNGANATGPVTIVLTGETVTNNTGTTWSGFDDQVVPEGVGSAPSITSAFTGGNLNSSYVLTLSGSSTLPGTILAYNGTQGAGVTTNWGSFAGDTSTLTISATGPSIFAFDEAPVTGSVAVPLPSAAWQSLGGLGALALFALRKKLLTA